MRLREFMLEKGYELERRFWNDFWIGEGFGVWGIEESLKGGFEEWKEK